MSKVSIIIPIYNAGNKLNKCIKSILKQTFTDFELILINDGSVDNSLYICKKYEQKDSRIVLINKHNEGTIATRKVGIISAKSDYIMFVDADDWIDETMIETLYKEITATQSDIVICNFQTVLGFIKQKNNSRYFANNKIYYREEIKKNLVTAYFHGHPFTGSLWGKLYKKDLFSNSGNHLNRIHFLGDDMFYNMELLLKANKLKIINKELYFYRAGGASDKYMPYFFEDVVNGYEIQKEFIEKFYSDTKKDEYNGISIMLLNMLKSALYNVFNSKYNGTEIKNIINKYVSNQNIIECLDNEGVIKYFPEEYLKAIRMKEIQYLFEFGENMYNKHKIKKVVKNVLIKFA